MGLKGVACALQAGFFAALASMCAKIATSASAAISVSNLGAAFFLAVFDMRISIPMSQVSTILRIIGVTGMFACNALMWVLFTKSMHLCFSTLEATAFNTASNFFFTAFLGLFLFGEHIAPQWYIGSVLMVIGLVILHKSSSDDKHLTDLQGEAVGSKTQVDKKEL